jgi:hypothetical protein
MIHDPATTGPHHAADPTPDRTPGSIRRTSSIDTSRPFGMAGEMVMDGRARDLLTGADGEARVAGEARLWARVDGPTRALIEITTVPAVPALQGLVGATVGPGWRGRVDQVLTADAGATEPGPDGVDGVDGLVGLVGSEGSLLYLLLDDLPGAGLVSGYAMQRSGGVRGAPEGAELEARVDLCAGWAADATILVAIRGHGQVPTPLGPVAPELARGDDPLGWHEMVPLGPTAMRRCRRLDVIAPAGAAAPAGSAAALAGSAAALSGSAETWPFDVFFRDSHVDGDGEETIVHEYMVGGTVDAAASRIVDIAAVADVLPWVECPNAVGSADRLRDRPLAGLRPWVRQTFTGPSTCTHLNDTLRGLTDLEALVRLVAAGV